MIGRPLHRVGLSAHIEFSVSFHRHAACVKYAAIFVLLQFELAVALP